MQNHWVRGLYECIQAIFVFRETNKQTKRVNRDFKSTENICRFSDVYMVHMYNMLMMLIICNVILNSDNFITILEKQNKVSLK